MLRKLHKHCKRICLGILLGRRVNWLKRRILAEILEEGWEDAEKSKRIIAVYANGHKSDFPCCNPMRFVVPPLCGGTTDSFFVGCFVLLMLVLKSSQLHLLATIICFSVAVALRCQLPEQSKICRYAGYSFAPCWLLLTVIYFICIVIYMFLCRTILIFLFCSAHCLPGVVLALGNE